MLGFGQECYPGIGSVSASSLLLAPPPSTQRRNVLFSTITPNMTTTTTAPEDDLHWNRSSQTLYHNGCDGCVSGSTIW